MLAVGDHKDDKLDWTVCITNICWIIISSVVAKSANLCSFFYVVPGFIIIIIDRRQNRDSRAHSK